MSRTALICGTLLAIAAPLPLAVAQEADAPATSTQTDAEEILRRVTDFYKKQKSVTFSSVMKMKSPQLPFPMEQASAVMIERPNLFSSQSEDSMMAGTNASSDGKEVTVGMPMFRLYSSTEAPPTFEAMIEAQDFDVDDPMAEPPLMALLGQDPGLSFGIMLFSDDPFTRMTEETSTISVVGKEVWEGREATRLAFRTNGDDPGMGAMNNVDVWIADGEEPWILAVRPDLSDVEGMDPMMAGMEMTIAFEDWNKLPVNDPSFEFVPGEDWKKVDDLMQAVMAEASAMGGGMDDMDMDMDMDDMDMDLGDFEEPAHPTIGMEAPDFTLKTLRSGEEVSLKSLRGKVVVLDFWATWCGPCVAGLPTMQKVTSAFKDRDVIFYGIDLREPADRVLSFVDKKKWTFPVLMDEKGDIARLYKVNGIPHSVVIGRDGTIRNVHIGFGGAEKLEKQLTEELEAAIAEKAPTG